MDVVVRAAGGEAEVTIGDDALAVGAVLTACTGRPSPTVVYVDGRAVTATATLVEAGAADGSVLDVARPPAPPAAVELAVIAGPGTGRRIALPSGRHRLGPGDGTVAGGELANGTVVLRPAPIEIDVGTAGVVRVRGTTARLDGREITAWEVWSGGIVTVGERAFTLHRPCPPDAAPPAGPAARTVHRGPRERAAAVRPPLAVPELPHAEGPGPRRFPLLALVAPLPLAGALALVLGGWRYLLFGLVSPVMLLTNWVDERRARRITERRADRAAGAAHDDFRASATARWVDDLARRRAEQPTIASVLARIDGTEPGLWARRSADGLTIPVGLADEPWQPALAPASRPIPVADVLAALGPLPAVPVAADVRAGGIGVGGDRARGRAVARGIVLTTVALHGPADLDVVVCAPPGQAGAWEWTKWLPHCRADGRPQIVTTADEAPGRLGVRRAVTERMKLVVADGDEWWRDHHAPLRGIEADPAIRLVALAAAHHLLPASCATTIAVPRIGPATISGDGVPTGATELLVPLLADDVAAAAARRLAGCVDPERSSPSGRAPPERVGVLDVLDLPPRADAVRARWAARPPTPRVPLGIAAGAGTVTIDLVGDGPHALVAGTTGSGKSELLRSLVVALAATLPPGELDVVLVDFKGGAAFDACARLPHTAAVVTDLDAHGTARLLRCLRAELTHRERTLRRLGRASLDEPGDAPLSRLVVVVDELALLVAALPAAAPALVDIAQRGRSLGLHLVLATQRPAGVVDATIKANTNMRIALRVQDGVESLDIVGVPDAAAIPRSAPGRAVVRLGAGDVVAVQTPLTTGTSPSRAERPPPTVCPFVLARPLTRLERRLAPAAVDSLGAPRPTDLDRLVDAIAAAAAAAGGTTARCLAPPPLPSIIDLDDVVAVAGEEPEHPDCDGSDAGAPFAVADLPDEQRRAVRRWRPGADGSLLLHGAPRAGTSSALAALAIGAARRYDPDDVHLYLLDADAGLLAPLDALPHVGAVVPVADGDRAGRLLRHLEAELARRRRLAAGPGGPAGVLGGEARIALLVDNAGALRHAADSAAGGLAGAWGRIEALVRDGPGLGLCVVLTASHERAVTTAIAAAIQRRLVFRLADRSAYAAFGLRAADVPPLETFGPGRAVEPDDAVEVQVARPPLDLAAAVTAVARRWDGHAARRRPTRIDPLPPTLTVADLLPHAERRADGLHVPVGLDRGNGRPRRVALSGRTVLLVVGPPGSGRSTFLAAVAAAARAADPPRPRFAIGPQPGPLAAPGLARHPPGAATVAAWMDEVLTTPGPRLLLVDDADELAGPSFERLAADRDRDLALVVAGTAAGLRAATHWSRRLLRSRTGLLLRPSTGDADALGVTLLRLPATVPGHGLLVLDGTPVPVLVPTAAAT